MRLSATKFSKFLPVVLLPGLLLTHVGQAQCVIALNPTVSGCYSVTGQSKATVSVEVSWQSAPAGKPITVRYAGQTRTITPGPISVTYAAAGASSVVSSQTIVSPQVVAFEVDLPATPSDQAVSAFFTSPTSCSAVSRGILLPAPCLPTPCAGGQTGGSVWNDFNADGVKQSGETTGIPGVVVNAYDCNNQLVATATTDLYGYYSFTGLTSASYPLRIEFTNLPAYAGMGTPNGTDGRTTVQFIDQPSCQIDLGVLDNTDYCQSNPKVVIPCYVNGDPLVSGSAGSSDAMIAFNYTASGANSASVSAHAVASQVGAIWGVAYNKFTRKVFTSATVKRHAGLGPLGLGGIYVADFRTLPANGSSFTFSNFIDVATLGINVGSIASNSARGLSGDKTKPSVDKQGYLAAGKVGIGGIDFSADGNILYLMNLYDNKLYAIDMTTYNQNGTLPTAQQVKSFDMTQGLTCTNGSLHSWGVKIYKGAVYTGLVCDAGVSQNKSDLRAFVQQLTGTTVSTIFDFPLTYPKGFPWDVYPTVTGWYPWTDNWSTKYVGNKINIYAVIHPEPILSSIEFDIDGSMVLSLADRTGIQGGWYNYNPNGNDGNLYETFVGGDILRAYSNGTSFVLENNAKAGPNVGYGTNNDQGPGFGEFYNDNFVFGKALQHAENAIGGLALLPGSGEVIEGAMDPLNDGASGLTNNAAGIRHLSNKTGLQTSGFLIYTANTATGTFGKAAGLGDAVLTCGTPAYLEIGNRAWIDQNGNGIQDACEKPLAGVLVSLYQGTTRIASTTTNANGDYYFTNNPISSTVAGTASTTLLQPSTAYQVVFGTNGTSNQYDAGTGILTTAIGQFTPTTAFSTALTASPLNDSNIQVESGQLIASVTTGPAGSVNHTIDAGFLPVPTCPPTKCAPFIVQKTLR